MRRLGLALALVAAVPAGGAAQTRNELIQAGLQAYAVPEPQRALQMLVAGVNPARGPRDSLWSVAAQTVVQILHDARQDSLADLWARWTVRQLPRMTLDTINFTPDVLQRFEAARGRTADPPGVRVDTDWRWPEAADMFAPGSIRAFGVQGSNLALIVVGRGSVQGGDSLALSAGTYLLRATAPGFLPTEVLREILPGVETRLTFRLIPEANGLLSIGSNPAALVFVDGERIGYTPIANLRLAAGNHNLRIQRPAQVLDTVVSVVRDGRVFVGTRIPAPQSARERALAAFDSGDVAGGMELLRRELTTATAAAARASTLLLLGAAWWWQGAPDSARVRFRDGVALDPFATIDVRRFSPELLVAYRTERRATPALGAHVAADTLLRPDSARWRVAVAVGAPGAVRLRLVGGALDTVLALVAVESTLVIDVPLRDSSGAPLVPGAYRLHAERIEASRITAARAWDLGVEALAVDTARHLVPLSDSLFMPETRRGGLAGTSLLRGVLLAGLAVVAPLALASADVDGASVQRGAIAIGGGIALAGVIGAIAGRPTVPLDAGIQHNRGLRESWSSRNTAIAAANLYARRYAPLRLRASPLP